MNNEPLTIPADLEFLLLEHLAEDFYFDGGGEHAREAKRLFDRLIKERMDAERKQTGIRY